MHIPLLENGSKLAFVNVSDVPAKVSTEKMQVGKSILEEMGFEVFIPEKTTNEDISPEVQIEILHSAFENDSIDGVICTSGGTKCLSLLPFVNFDLIKSHPKRGLEYSPMEE